MTALASSGRLSRTLSQLDIYPLSHLSLSLTKAYTRMSQGGYAIVDVDDDVSLDGMP